MTFELIYTSAPRGLRAGASGYCTVAQTRGMREDLVAALERRSLFTHEPKGDSPIYYSYRILSLAGTNWRVLSRAKDAGLDFTGRRHYLVHHLVLETSEELTGWQPAEILLGWSGWRDSWSGTPVQLEGPRNADLCLPLARIGLPAREWKRQTGDAGWAASAGQMPSPVGWQSAGLSSTEMLRLMGESTALMENTQRGGSWLTTMDVGGAANPVSKDCLWSGRTYWGGVAPMSGVRSIFRIEDCRGKEPKGRTEEIEMARSGQGRAIARIGTATPRNLVAESEVSPGTGSGRETESQSCWKPLALIGVLLVGAFGVGSLFFKPSQLSTPTQPVTFPASEKKSQQVATPLPEEIPQRSDTPGQALARILWAEAGGVEQIEFLHLLFETPSVNEIDEKLGQMSATGGGAGMAHLLEGWVGPVSLQSDLNEFARKASRQRTAWSLFVPGSPFGLVFLPDLSVSSENRKISSGKLLPHEVLRDLEKHVWPNPQRWFIKIKFPALGDKHFPEVPIEPDGDEEEWLRLWNQHREEILAERMRALCRALPASAQNPQKWTEKKIREIAAEMEKNSSPEVYDEFLRLHKSFLQSWDPPQSDQGAQQIFQSLLKNREAKVEVWLSGYPGLEVGRLIP